MKEKQPGNPDEAMYWYSKARDKAQELIKSGKIDWEDRDLTVRVEFLKRENIKPVKGESYTGGYTLRFEHKSNPDLYWNMGKLENINQDYLDNDFEHVLVETYRLEKSLAWYRLAKRQAEALIAYKYPELSVSIGSRPGNPSLDEPREVYVLIFEHERHAKLHWFMKIEESSDYIDAALEKEIEEAYFQLKDKYDL